VKPRRKQWFFGSIGFSVALLVATGLVFCGILLTAAPSEAQDLDCSDFDSQEEARNELEDNPSDPNNLDADDGTACESLSSGSAHGNDQDDDSATPSTQDDQDGEDRDGLPSSQNTARAGGAVAQSSPGEATTELRNRARRDRFVRGTVPNKPLPPTGGLPVYVAVTGSLLAGVSLFGLGLLIRQGS
jgi:hypothetical protein